MTKLRYVDEKYVRPLDSLPQTKGFTFIAVAHDGSTFDCRMAWCVTFGRYKPATTRTLSGWLPLSLKGYLK